MEEARLRLTRHVTEGSAFTPSTSAVIQDHSVHLSRPDELHVPSRLRPDQAVETTTLGLAEQHVAPINHRSPSPHQSWPAAIALDHLGPAGAADDASQPQGDTASTGFASLDWSAFGDLDYSGFLRGHPGEDSDLELYYYRSVSSSSSPS